MTDPDQIAASILGEDDSLPDDAPMDADAIAASILGEPEPAMDAVAATDNIGAIADLVLSGENDAKAPPRNPLINLPAKGDLVKTPIPHYSYNPETGEFVQGTIGDVTGLSEVQRRGVYDYWIEHGEEIPENLANDLYNLGAGVVSMIWHGIPWAVDVGSSAAKAAVGGPEDWNDLLDVVSTPVRAVEASADQIGTEIELFGPAYFIEHPLDAALLASAGLGGASKVAGAVGRAAEGAGASRAAEIAGRAAEVARSAQQWTDPIHAATKAAGAGMRGARGLARALGKSERGLDVVEEFFRRPSEMYDSIVVQDAATGETHTFREWLHKLNRDVAERVDAEAIRTGEQLAELPAETAEQINTLLRQEGNQDYRFYIRSNNGANLAEDFVEPASATKPDLPLDVKELERLHGEAVAENNFEQTVKDARKKTRSKLASDVIEGQDELDVALSESKKAESKKSSAMTQLTERVRDIPDERLPDDLLARKQHIVAMRDELAESVQYDRGITQKHARDLRVRERDIALAKSEVKKATGGIAAAKRARKAAKKGERAAANKVLKEARENQRAAVYDYRRLQDELEQAKRAAAEAEERIKVSTSQLKTVEALERDFAKDYVDHARGESQYVPSKASGVSTEEMSSAAREALDEGTRKAVDELMRKKDLSADDLIPVLEVARTAVQEVPQRSIAQYMITKARAKIVRELHKSRRKVPPVEFYPSKHHSLAEMADAYAANLRPKWIQARHVQLAQVLKSLEGGEQTKGLMEGLAKKKPDLAEMVRSVETLPEHEKDYLRWVAQQATPSYLKDAEGYYFESMPGEKPIQVAEVPRMASSVRQLLMKHGSELVGVELLPPEVVVPRIEKYIADLYKHFEQTGLIEPEKVLERTARFEGIEGERLLPAFVKYVKEYSKRRKAGLLGDKDLGYVIAKSLAQTAHDIEWARFQRMIRRAINPETNEPLIRESLTDGYVALPKSMRWRSLYGVHSKAGLEKAPVLYAPREMAHYMKHIERTVSDALKVRDLPLWKALYQHPMATYKHRILPWWKANMTSLNPAVHTRNVVTNMQMAIMSGLNPFNPSIPTARSTLRKVIPELRRMNSRDYLDASRGGLFGKTFATQEARERIQELLSKVEEPKLSDATEMSFGWHMANSIMDGAGKFLRANRAVRTFASDVYSLEEELFKYWKFKQVRALQRRFAKTGQIDREMQRVFGNTEAAAKVLAETDADLAVLHAVDEAQRWFFDYSDVPGVVEWIRSTPLPFAQPFITFSYKAIPRMSDWISKNPIRAFAYGQFSKTLNFISQMKDGEVPSWEETLQKERSREFLPPYKRTGSWAEPGVKYFDLSTGKAGPYAGFTSFQYHTPFGGMTTPVAEWENKLFSVADLLRAPYMGAVYGAMNRPDYAPFTGNLVDTTRAETGAHAWEALKQTARNTFPGVRQSEKLYAALTEQSDYRPERKRFIGETLRDIMFGFRTIYVPLGSGGFTDYMIRKYSDEMASKYRRKMLTATTPREQSELSSQFMHEQSEFLKALQQMEGRATKRAAIRHSVLKGGADR